jgi:aspartyl-tRNA(Asn)/glutamyl-tRNA(Gln) amidotransferase subunit A
MNVSDSDIVFLTLREAAALVESRKISPVELTRACLARIERLNPSLNAFITVTADRAMEDARAAETAIVRGNRLSPLHGIPIALKDMIDTAGVRTTAASALFEHRVPAEDAEVTMRLKRAGAILLGKLNMQEFAYGGTSVPSRFGPVRNPHDLERMAGGSSGGSAAAVAAGLCFAALGTDTGGSIREPAAFCGVVGMKPTYGLVSNRGVIPLAASLDHVGPLARNAEDCALVLHAIAGYDARDIASERAPPAPSGRGPSETRPAAEDLEGVRIGVPREFYFDELDLEVRAGVDRALELLSELGAAIEEIRLPVSTDRTVFCAEAFAAHAEHMARAPELYLPETFAKLERGATIDAPAYIAAVRALREQRRAVAETLSGIDAIVTPTTPVPAPRIADYPQAFEQVLALEASRVLRNTRPFNMYAIPALTVPCGRTAAGLPIGLHLASAAWHDGRVLALALAYETAADGATAAGRRGRDAVAQRDGARGDTLDSQR